MDSPTSLNEWTERACKRQWLSAGQREAVLSLDSLSPSRSVIADELGLEAWQVEELSAAASLGAFGQGRYELTGVLGQGGMGVVYEARDHQLGRRVAIKVLTQALSARHRERFDREAAVTARIRHPAVVQVFDVGVSQQGQPYLVLELVEGTCLSQHSGVECQLAARWGRDLAEALEACHQLGVVHRDVKPSNVLLDATGQVRLTDFGVAYDQDAETRLTQQGAVGTLTYLAPEILTGGIPTAQSDVYALGATLYELVCGRPPFVSELALDLIRRIACDPVPKPSDLADDVASDFELVLLKCLRKNPGDRYQSAADLALEFSRFSTGLSVQAGAPSLAKRVRAIARKHWRVSAALLMAGVLGAGVPLVSRSLGEVSLRQSAEADLKRARGFASAPSSAEGLATAREHAQSVAECGIPDLVDQSRALLRRISGLDQIVSASADLAELDTVWERTRGAQTESEEEIRVRRASVSALAEAAKRKLALGALLLGDEDPGPSRSLGELSKRLALFQSLDAPWNLTPGDRHLKELGGELSVQIYGAEFSTTVRLFGAETPGTIVRVEGAVGKLAAFLPAGLYSGKAEVAGALDVRFALHLLPGETREIRVEPVLNADLPPLLRSGVVHLAGGRVRLPPGRNYRNVSPFMILRTEVPFEEYKSYWIQAGRPTEGLPANIRGLQDFHDWSIRVPVVNVRLGYVAGFLSWLNAELALRGSAFRAELPRIVQSRYAALADFPWRYPWGNEEPVTSVDVPRLRPVGSSLLDQSVLGVSDLALSAQELGFGGVSRSGGQALEVYGASDWDHNFQVERALWGLNLIQEQTLGHKHTGAVVGFRYVLELSEEPERARKPSRGVQATAAARELFRKRAWRLCAQKATQALEADNRIVEAWLLRGASKLYMEDYWGAWWDCEQALEIDPKCQSPMLWRTLMESHWASERYERARKAVDNAIRVEPQNRHLLFWRGAIKGQLGDVAGGIKDVEAYLERPDQGQVEQARETLRRLKAQLAEAEKAKRRD